ncbi:PREDICTED: disintegrin and metalloproteinase domain-containing protein 20-like [Chinchilla lanigera]|uniref:disintegrin and metalloproteinase domain-containing protein 20-like n=1 Tax=Chinchilla lanigera TaxID=34839 RepID=UPI00038EF0D6|nr:PREDICTED: disintegrin and metalloproteinase domain-containing protein 20-like [Chinchilla lanigera]
MCALTLYFRKALDDTLGHMKFTLLLLGTWAFSILSMWPLTGNCQYFNPPEVVIPLRIPGTSRGTKNTGWVSYSLHLAGQRHIVHMKAKKMLVPKHISLVTYTDQGMLQEDHPFIPRDCYYHGYAEGDLKSLVALSTCFGGLQGMLYINNSLYEIKPKNLSTTFEHLAYKVHPMDDKYYPSPHEVTEDTAKEWQMNLKEIKHSILKQSTIKNWYVHQFWYKVGYVIDAARFNYKRRNATAVEVELILGTNIVDSYYKTMGADVQVVAIDIWNQNLVREARGVSLLNDRFCEWKAGSYNHRVVHDAVFHIFVKRYCTATTQKANFLGLCGAHQSCGSACHTTDNLLTFSTIVARMIGILTGFHEDYEFCQCAGTCIMRSSTPIANAFSNCSYDSFMLAAWVLKTCIYNAPQRLFRIAFCGNAQRDRGEACDCGTAKACAGDPCCTASCTLSDGSNCAGGLCCKDCRIANRSTECREQISECDLPEFCDGKFPDCPEDVYVANGYPCLGKGSCFQGTCNNHNFQCKRIFGPSATSANMRCYQELNSKGDRFGHCFRRNAKYEGCRSEDVLCGRIQCANVKQIPLLKDHESFSWIHLKPEQCWSLDYHFGRVDKDIGAVSNGSECGEGKFCISSRCVPMPRFSICAPRNCSERGICNNKFNCHCDPEYAPPTCFFKGTGGSVDSGPPPKINRTIFIISKKKGKQKSLQSTLIVIFVVILLLLLVLFVLSKKSQKSAGKPPPPPGPTKPPPAPPGKGPPKK